MIWAGRSEASEHCPAKAIEYGPEGCFARHPRLVGLKEVASSMPPGAVAGVNADASSKNGRGVAMGDESIWVGGGHRSPSVKV